MTEFKQLEEGCIIGRLAVSQPSLCRGVPLHVILMRVAAFVPRAEVASFVLAASWPSVEDETFKEFVPHMFFSLPGRRRGHRSAGAL